MTWEIEYGKGVLALPAEVMAYLDKADHLTLKLYMRLASDPALRASFDPAAFAKSYAVTPQTVERALEFWCNAGLLVKGDEACDGKTAVMASPIPAKVSVSQKTAPNGETVTVVTGGMPNYSGKEIEAIMTGDPTLSLLVEECQRIAGKMFGAHEITRLLGMADYLRLDHESILLLFAYAARIEKCSVAYVEKMAVGLVQEGINTYSAIEGYIAQKEKLHTVEGVLRKLAGLGSRAFTAKEKKFLAKWSELGISEELMALAYEVTVNNTGGFAFPYMNKVLLNWREAGYTTASEVNDAIAAYRDKKDSESGASFNVDEFFEAALRRSYERSDPAVQ